MTPHERADHLFNEATKLGMDAPTADMIASAICDAEADALNFPAETAEKHHNWTDGGHFVAAVRKAVGTLAEHAARDLDHIGADHKNWYRAVKLVRKYVRLHTETGAQP